MSRLRTGVACILRRNRRPCRSGDGGAALRADAADVVFKVVVADVAEYRRPALAAVIHPEAARQINKRGEEAEIQRDHACRREEF